MDWLEEVRRLEKIRNAVKSFVVDQDRAQQRLFLLVVVRSGTEEWCRYFGLLAGCRISECHGCLCLPGNCGIARGLSPQRAGRAVVPQFTSCIERWERPVFPLPKSATRVERRARYLTGSRNGGRRLLSAAAKRSSSWEI